MSTKSIKLGFEIEMEKGAVPQPKALHVWNTSEKVDKAGPQKPFKYMADALCGLSVIRLHPTLNCPVVRPEANMAFCEKAWTALDPHWELWQRAQDRVQSLHREVKKVDAKICAEFEKKFTADLDAALKSDGVKFRDLCGLIDTINSFETKKNAPMLYNFGLKFSPAFTQKLHSLYSMLFHLRSVVAIDWNAHVEDHSHEAVRVDSITDYLPKAEYVVNDAMMYWQFLKLSHPFVAGKNSDVKVEKLLVEPMRKMFMTSSHNACYLIDHLPRTFIERMGPGELEEALYLVQMDWLLGSEAGLLFRIREELYGLQSGYEKIFWHDLEGSPAKKPMKLSLCFELKESDLRHAPSAA